MSEIIVEGMWWQEDCSDEEGKKIVLIDAYQQYHVYVWYLTDDSADAAECDLLNWYLM